MKIQEINLCKAAWDLYYKWLEVWKPGEYSEQRLDLINHRLACENCTPPMEKYNGKETGNPQTEE